MSEHNDQPHAVQPAKGTPAKRVLVVDDNIDAADALAMILRLKGHVTHCAYEPESALKSAVEFGPDMIFLDIGLPRMDGYEVAKRIRADNTAVRLVALTGYGRGETEQARAAGFDAYLLKPLDFDELERVFERLR